jgi:hypothetical protein
LKAYRSACVQKSITAHFHFETNEMQTPLDNFETSEMQMSSDWLSLPMEIWFLIIEYVGSRRDHHKLASRSSVPVFRITPMAIRLYMSCKFFSWLKDQRFCFLVTQPRGFDLLTVDIFGKRDGPTYRMGNFSYFGRSNKVYGYCVYENDRPVGNYAYDTELELARFGSSTFDACTVLIIDGVFYRAPDMCCGTLCRIPSRLLYEDYSSLLDKAYCDCPWCSQLVKVENELKKLDPLIFDPSKVFVILCNRLYSQYRTSPMIIRSKESLPKIDLKIDTTLFTPLDKKHVPSYFRF